MKIKTVSFSTTEMNVTSNFVTKDAFIDFSASGQGVSIQTVDVIRRYPINARITNTGGVDIEVAFIGVNEDSDFTSNPNDYFFLLKSADSINSYAQFPRINKVSIRKVSGNTTASVRVDFYNHQGTLKIN